MIQCCNFWFIVRKIEHVGIFFFSVLRDDELFSGYLCCFFLSDEHCNPFSSLVNPILEYFVYSVCPVCTKRVGLDIVGHITTQHANFFKVQRRRRLRRGGYSSTYLALKKELREANLQSLLGGSSSFTSSTNIDSDPLLSSFMFNSPSVNQSANKSATPVTVGNAATKVSIKESLKRDIQEAPLSGEDQEKAKKSEFVRGLLLSTMLEDDF